MKRVPSLCTTINSRKCRICTGKNLLIEPPYMFLLFSPFLATYQLQKALRSPQGESGYRRRGRLQGDQQEQLEPHGDERPLHVQCTMYNVHVADEDNTPSTTTGSLYIIIKLAHNVVFIYERYFLFCKYY